MVNKGCVMKLLSKMTDNLYSNSEKIKSTFGKLDYKDCDAQSILHILVDDVYDEEKCFLAIQTLLEIGISPNLVDNYKYNFIQTALYAGYSEKFIFNIINESLKYDLDINHVDSDGDTIMHTAIYSDDYSDDLERFYDLLCDNGFDSSIKDNDDRDLVNAMIFMATEQAKYSDITIASFENKFNERCLQASNNNISNTAMTASRKDLIELEEYGKVLNIKDYITRPTIGRDKELKNLMITLAQEKKNPLIVGESGVGKTAIVDELAYRIKIGEVPNFLKGRIILEVNPSDVVAGCRYVGMFEDNMIKLMDLCEEQDAIIFIDQIHTIYGIGSSKDKDNDMSAMLKHYIDRSNLKVIGTTTEKEYNEFFSKDALKRRFEKISIKEPTEEVLYQIIDKVIIDYNEKNKIYFKDENIRQDIVNIILDATAKSHRIYNDMVNNPDLSISIIDKAFAFAKIYDSEFITLEHFAESFEYCDRIYDSAKEQAISRLKNLSANVSKPVQKILKLDFNKFKK